MMNDKQHLILLVGTNPLPNYITARYLANRIEQLYLVHTEKKNSVPGTLHIAEGLKKQLSKRLPEVFTEGKISLMSLSSECDAENIYQNLNTCLKLPPNARVHLNYTGGTKAMAVHVYQWVKQTTEKPAFSYLDARTYRLVYDEGVENPSEDLRTKVCVEDINELLALHGYPLHKEREENPFSDAMAHMSSIVEDGLAGEFIQWKNEILGAVYHNGEGWIVKSKHLGHFDRKIKEEDAESKDSAERLPVTEAPFKLDKLEDAIRKGNRDIQDKQWLRELLMLFPEENRIVNEDGTLWIPPCGTSNSALEQRIKETIKEFLDGKWLEYHVHDTLAELIAEMPDSAIRFGMSLKPENDNGKFELDIFALRGYQLFGISVTTDGRDHAKSKAFEVLHRVKQIGGDESRAILIAGMDDKKAEEMKKNVSFLMSGAAEDQFQVIGISSWGKAKLKAELRRILCQ
jgi:hypothetical protein